MKTHPPVLPVDVFLQGKIFRFIFGEVQGFWLGRDPLARIVSEAKAAVFGAFYPPLAAKDQPLFHCRTVDTVAAAAGNLFPEKHRENLLPEKI